MPSVPEVVVVENLAGDVEVQKCADDVGTVDFIVVNFVLVVNLRVLMVHQRVVIVDQVNIGVV